MRKRSLLALMILLCLLLTGCYAFDSESFYALPKRSEQFSELQAAAEAAMNGGEYSAPVSGSNRQAVQQADLDGDGTDEALVFCKTGVSMPLKVLILKRNDSSYRLLTTVESDGTAFDSVQYAEMDGAPGLELILSRRIGEQVQQYLGVYTLDNGAAVELLSVRCSLYTTLDMDRDQRTDLFVLQSNSEGPTAYANLYRWRDGSLQKDAEASLSMASESVKRVLTGNLSMNVPAVFIASAYDESNLITDVFALRRGVFTNVTQNAESGQSSQTVRNYYVYGTDIDNDGIIEMPDTVALAELPDDAGSRGQYRIVWYTLNLNGQRTDKMSTYHNYGEGWFLFLPESWCSDGLTVTRIALGSSQTGTRFSTLDESGQETELATVAAFSGENAEALSTSDGFFPLMNRGGIVYAARLGDGASLTPDELSARFSSIAPDLLPESE